jgi:hypothetical protein
MRYVGVDSIRRCDDATLEVKPTQLLVFQLQPA